MTYDKLERELGGAREQIRRLKHLLEDVLFSGVVEYPPSVKYLDVQIDKGTWNEIKEALK